jgi:hypothetical protein
MRQGQWSFVAVLALLLAAPIAAGASTFFEDFEDGVADGFTPVGPGWEVSGGTYNCETTGFEIYSSSIFGDPLWGDVSIAFDIRSEDSVNHLLRFRVNDFEDYYVVNLRSSPWNDVRLHRVMNTVPAELAKGGAVFDNASWHHVEVVLNGFQFEVYLDDALVLLAADPEAPDRLRTGQCAVVSYSGGVIQHQYVSYDNVLVLENPVAVENLTLSSVKALFQ